MAPVNRHRFAGLKWARVTRDAHADMPGLAIAAARYHQLIRQRQAILQGDRRPLRHTAEGGSGEGEVDALALGCSADAIDPGYKRQIAVEAVMAS